MSVREAITSPRVLDTLLVGDDVRRTCGIANHKTQRIKSLCDNNFGVELGTGVYASDGQGRKDTPWVYQDSEGKHHSTGGIMPVHFLKKAATEHGDEYKELMEKSMKNG